METLQLVLPYALWYFSGIITGLILSFIFNLRKCDKCKATFIISGKKSASLSKTLPEDQPDIHPTDPPKP